MVGWRRREVVLVDCNYNEESKDTRCRRYAYDFDHEVMHPFMLRSFEPFFVNGSMLELGSSEGRFTECLLPYFTDVTCVEASDEAIAKAKAADGHEAEMIEDAFESVGLSGAIDNGGYSSRMCSHVNDPIAVLRRIDVCGSRRQDGSSSSVPMPMRHRGRLL